MPQVGPVADSVAQFGAFADAVDSGRLLSPIVSITPSEPVSVNPDVTEKGLGASSAASAAAAAGAAVAEPQPPQLLLLLMILLLLLRQSPLLWLPYCAAFFHASTRIYSFPGLFLSIPLNDQGDPTDGSRSLSNQTNCDAAVQNLAVYSIDHEADDSADAAGGCIGELIPSGTGSGAIQLCSCKFLVPHFSAFAVVDTAPSNGNVATLCAPYGFGCEVSFSSSIGISVATFFFAAVVTM